MKAVGEVPGAAQRLGHGGREVMSCALRKACGIDRMVPMGMVKVICRCAGGLSHNEAAEISPEWAAAGTDVLLHAALEVAEVVG